VGQILVIADDAACRGIVRRILAVQRHAVLEAATAEGGRLAKEVRPALILKDTDPGDTDGFSLLAEVRATPAIATVPVIMMTGRQEATDMRRGMDSGADDYLQKPFDALSLLGAVEARLHTQDTFLRSAEKPPVVEPTPVPLSARETEIAKLPAPGHSNKDVARQLGISVKTANMHRTNLGRKRGPHSVTEPVRCAIRHGLVET
jgi:DNA-binding NarL/FixJ family response regulator